MNIITLNRVLLNNTPLNYRRKRILTEKDFYFKTIERTFTFSKSAGGKSIKDGRAYIKRIKGNSVVWNQYCQSAESRTHNGVTFTNNGDGSWTINGTAEGGTALVVISSLLKNKRHKWLITGLEGGSKTTYYAGDGRYILSYNGICDTSQESINETNISLRVVAGASVENLKVYPRIYDLTQMFGAGNEPTTIEDFYARVATLGVDLNAYNEGQVIHCNTKSIKSIGDNALNADRSLVFDFDGSYGNYDFINTEDAFVGLSADGYINNGAIDYAEKIECGFRFRSNGGGYGIGLFVKALPNEEYSVSYASDNGRITFGFYDKGKNLISYELWGNRFTTPSNCEYIMLCLRDNEVINVDISFTDIMLTLVHSGWKQNTDAGYQPYWEDTLPLPIIRKYFPQGMKSAGTAHDEIYYDKMQNKKFAVQRIGQVNAWELIWNYMGISESNPYGRFSTAVSGRQINKGNILCTIYTTQGASYTTDKNIFGAGGANTIVVIDSAYTDKASFKAMLQEKQVVLYYELAEPIVTELDAEDQNFRDYYNVADFGTEMSQSSVPSAALLADVGYYFKKSEVKELTLN